MAANSKKIWADVDVLKEQYTELACKAWEKFAKATVAPAMLIAVVNELDWAKSELVPSRAKRVNSHWSVHSVAESARTVEDDARRVHMAMSDVASDATKWQVSVIGLVL